MLIRVRELLAEALASAASQRVASIATVVVVAGMCLAVILTTGRAVGAQQAVLNTLDSAGTRSIVVRADLAAGLDSGVVERVSTLDGAEWVGAFGPGVDVRNAAVDGGAPVALRRLWSSDLAALGVPVGAESGDVAWGSRAALEVLGMAEGSGGAADGAGSGVVVRQAGSTLSSLDMLEPLLFAPAVDSDVGTVSYLVVVAERPELVAPLSDILMSMLDVSDPSLIEVQTSAELAQLRGLVEGQLGTFGRTLTLSILALMGVLVAAVLAGLVLLRRTDFGRRRALGATRGLIVVLLLSQTAILAAIGAVLGIAAALAVLAIGADPLPDVGYIAGLATISIATATGAALTPAVVAARRDPLAELRVP